MVLELLELAFGFLVLVTASYVGTTMALRGFFGRERYESPFENGGGGGTSGDGDARIDDVPRASDLRTDDAEDG